MTTVQGPSPESLEVLESGRTLKVRTDGPHLVSLGSGRLSTAITLHPLCEGNTRVGSSETVDVKLSGPGVEPLHCVLETTNGVVTLHPAAGMTTVDGIPVATPLRLQQGSVLCLGISTHVRFNHPTEARTMKTRAANGDGRPPLVPLRQSWDDTTNGSDDGGVFNKVSKFEHLAQSQSQSQSRSSISPKVFPMGSATLNSPASAVLGHSRLPNGFSHDVENCSPGRQNGVYGYIDPPIAQAAVSFPQKISASYVNSYSHEPVQNGFGNPLFTSYDGRQKPLESPLRMPSPAFNRNPAPFVPERTRSTTPSISGSRSSYSPAHSHEDLNARTEELIKAQMNRKREEVVQMLEKQRLEEILAVCAEYEKQSQASQHQKPPTTPTLQQNRIKTNGSLPRDIRTGGLSPSAGSNSDDELCQILHVPGSPRSLRSRNTQGLRSLSPEIGSNRSPYENLNRPNQLDVTVHKHVYVENTLIIEASDIERPPPSPRTRIKTSLRDVSGDAARIKAEPIDSDPFSDYDSVDPVQRRHFSPNLERRQYLTPSQQLTKFNEIMAEPVSSPETPDDKFILPLGDASDLSDVIDKFDKQMSLSMNGDSRGSESRVSHDSGNDLPESERDLHIILPKLKENSQERKFSKSRKRNEDKAKDKQKRGLELVSFLRPKKMDPEEMALRAEKDKLVEMVGSIKANVQNIQQQEEEILRDMEFERALLEAEYLMQRDKRKHEEDKLDNLQDKQRLLDVKIEQSQLQDSESQSRCLDRIKELEIKLLSLGERSEMTADYCRLMEALDNEKKVFEDLEFKHLEEEANWLTTREDLQREIDDIAHRIEGRTIRLQELERQVQEMQKSSANESSVLELKKLQLLQKLEEARTRLKDLDTRLSTHSSVNNSSDNDDISEVILRPKSKQSQEDLDRISRITSDAPIDVGKSASLNRKTIESLKEIERNRHLHLAMQGVQVIEEERKRVEQLKRRVQDEVRAQWEQNRQRQSNGNHENNQSHNSIGSEESSFGSSDLPSDSMSSEDVEKTRASAFGAITNGVTVLPPIADVNPELMDSMIRDGDDESSLRDSRPISDYSSSDFDQSCVVKKRDSHHDRLLQQRPLTRYLPIRGDSLNLRQHIESAGHQVDLCKHVIIDATSCRGLLHKMAGKFHHWNKRWFVFDRVKKSLTYYSDRSERKPRGGTYFQWIEEVYVDHLNSVKSPQPHLTFVIKTKERMYHLMAPSAEAMRIWVDVVFTGAEGYQEFEPRT